MRKRTKEFYERMNKVNEKLASMDLSGEQNRYCWALFRKTLAWGKYEDRISRSQIAEMTGMLEVNVSRTKRELKKGNIIQCNGKIQRFNLNIEQWKKVSIRIPIKKVSIRIQKGIHQAEKKGIHRDTYKETTKKTLKEGRDFYMKLSRKEIEGLETENWYRAVMWNYGKFGMEYIEKTIKEYDYDTRMSCWYIYADSGNIRNKEAFFSHLLRNYKEDLEK